MIPPDRHGRKSRDMTPTKRTKEQMLAGAPIEFELNGRKLSASPPGFGEGMLLRARIIEFEVESGLRRADYINEEASLSGGEIVVREPSPEAAARLLRAMPQMLEFLLDFAGIGEAERIEIDRDLGKNVDEACGQIASAYYGKLVASLNPTLAAKMNPTDGPAKTPSGTAR